MTGSVSRKDFFWGGGHSSSSSVVVRIVRIVHDGASDGRRVVVARKLELFGCETCFNLRKLDIRLKKSMYLRLRAGHIHRRLRVRPWQDVHLAVVVHLEHPVEGIVSELLREQ